MSTFPIMVNNSTRRAIRAVIAVLLALVAGLIISRQDGRTDAEWLAESHRLVSEYEPDCDGKTMRPGDVCIAYGRGAARLSGSYEDRVERYAATVTVDDLKRGEMWWRLGGYALLGVAVLLLLTVIVRLWTVLRVGPGRRALAAANGWTYQREDRALAALNAVADYRTGQPRASHIVTGTRGGCAFQIYSYLDRYRSERCAFRVTLEMALPRMQVIPALLEPFSPDTAPEVRALLIAKFGVLPTDPGSPGFAADGTALMRVVTPSPAPAAMLKTLDETIDLSRRLIAALTAPGTDGDEERVAAYLKRRGRLTTTRPR